MDVDSFSKGSRKRASKGSGKGNNLEVACWFCEKKGHRASECCKKSKDLKKGDDKSA